jgi:bacterioferritin-associated ferredoxin
MLVCHCFVIRACDVRTAIARGARTPGEVARACRAGAGCGGCQPVIEELLDEHADRLHLAAARRATADGEERTKLGA